MLSTKNIKKIIIKYFFRILLFLVFYHGLVLPTQIKINEKIIEHVIKKKLIVENDYEIKINKHHTKIFLKGVEMPKLHFSIPFGQAYFFLLFFLWFKPYNLIKAISLYNLILVPIYTLALIFFFNGYDVFGKIIIANESAYRLTYGSIFLLKTIRPQIFILIFEKSRI